MVDTTCTGVWHWRAGKNKDLLKRARSGIDFMSLFEVASFNSTAGACPEGFTSVNTVTALECLKLKVGWVWACQWWCGHVNGSSLVVCTHVCCGMLPMTQPPLKGD